MAVGNDCKVGNSRPASAQMREGLGKAGAGTGKAEEELKPRLLSFVGWGEFAEEGGQPHHFSEGGCRPDCTSQSSTIVPEAPATLTLGGWDQRL